MSVEYRDIKGFPGYRVGNDGSVWTLWVRGHSIIGKVWKQKTASRGRGCGYLSVLLRGEQKEHRLYVHRLVLEAFVGPCPEGMEACHGPDQSPLNNRLENLRWDTPANNQADRVANGTSNRGERQHLAKLTAEKVVQARLLHATGEYSMPSIARKFGVSTSTMRLAVLGKQWAHVREALPA